MSWFCIGVNCDMVFMRSSRLSSIFLLLIECKILLDRR
jgi:hypothetical protein